MGSLHAAKVAALAAEGRVRSSASPTSTATRAEQLARPHGVRAVADFRALARPRRTPRWSRCPPCEHFAVVAAALEAGPRRAGREADRRDARPRRRSSSRGARARGARAPGGPPRVVQRRGAEGARAIRRPRFVEAHRMGPFPARATDVDVVRDLMIHDLDIVQRLVGEEPERVDAIGVPVLSDEVDIANARLTLPGRLPSRTSPRAASRPRRCARCASSSPTATSRSTSSSRRW